MKNQTTGNEMNRRNFLTTTAALGTAALTAAVAGPVSAATKTGGIIIDGLDTSTLNEEFLEMLRGSGVDCAHRSVGDVGSIGAIYEFVDKHPDEVMVAKSVADIELAREEGKISFVLGAQAANYLERLYNKTPFERYGAMRNTLRGFTELGLRTHGICYNVTNLFGGGCMDHDVPLTRAGEQLVEAIHNYKVILDVGGHTGEQTSLDAIAMSSGVPIVCTHTNIAALNPNPRAITDRLAEAIAGTGGVIGITAISDFLMRSAESLEEYPDRSPEADLDVILDQYDYLKKLVGADHVGLGPDFIWGWGDKVDFNTADAMVFPNDTMSNGSSRTVKDYEDISKLPNLIAGLEGRGWSQEELDKLQGRNWLRVYRQVWGA